MKKYIFLVLCLVSSLSFAREILCPEKILCTDGACRPFPRVLGDIWVAADGGRGGAGFVGLEISGTTVDGRGLCIFGADTYFVSTLPLYQDRTTEDQRWNPANNRCISTIAHYCPFTDVPPTQKG